MEIQLKRLNDAVRFEATNAEGNTVLIEGGEAAGGEGQGVRPTEMLLMSVAACSSIDVVLFLKKMRQELKDIKVDVTGGRDKNEVPSLFKTIHLSYHLYGDLKKEKVEKALQMSIEKYCSVAKMLEKTATITYDYVIHK